jgi:hypothetical protein
VRFQILKAASTNLTAMLDIEQCSILKYTEDSEARNASKTGTIELKRWSSLTRLHGAIPQKAVIFNVIVRLSVIVTKLCVFLISALHGPEGFIRAIISTEKSRYPLFGRLSEHLRRSEHCDYEENCSAPAKIRTPVSNPINCHFTMLPQLTKPTYTPP